MRKKKNYSVFNNFNKHYHYMKEPNYFDEYENEFSEDLFRNLDHGIANGRKRMPKSMVQVILHGAVNPRMADILCTTVL